MAEVLRVAWLHRHALDDYHDGGSCKSPCCYQLLLLCDEFKARLQHAQQTQLHLADVLVAKALA